MSFFQPSGSGEITLVSSYSGTYELFQCGFFLAQSSESKPTTRSWTSWRQRDHIYILVGEGWLELCNFKANRARA